MMRPLLAAAVLYAALTACSAASASGAPVSEVKLTVCNVVADTTAFTPEKGERVSWRYRLSGPARITVCIFDSRNVLVRTITKDKDLKVGDHDAVWDGTDETDRAAPPGYYLLTISAQADGSTVTWDPSDSTGGSLIRASSVGVDSDSHVVHYVLARPALVRILLGVKNGPTLRTLVDWVARPFGMQSEPWDGWDASGVQQFDRSPRLEIAVWAYELPVNAVVVLPRDKPALAPTTVANGRSQASTPARSQYLDFAIDRQTRPAGANRPFELYNHWLHDRVRCHDPKIQLNVPPETARDDKGIPVLADAPLSIRLEAPAEEAIFIQNERFELVAYLDGNFVSEQEQGYLPLSWTLQPAIVTPGEHVVTFMVRGYDGHFGTASIRVRKFGDSTSPMSPVAAGDAGKGI